MNISAECGVVPASEKVTVNGQGQKHLVLMYMIRRICITNMNIVDLMVCEK